MTGFEVLRQYWGFNEFRPLQQEIIDAVLDGQDTLALLPTGGGKSICFQVPAMVMEGICIVISPLIALMKDQVENLNIRGIKALSITSGMTKREIDIALDNCIYGNIKFLYLSPERLLSDLVRERISYMKVNLLAVDEAHCISQWGYDFRPPYLHIADFRQIHPKIPILALTASATLKVQEDILIKLNFKTKNILKKSFERKNLSYAVLEVENKLGKLVDVCTSVKGSGIVYVKSRKETFELAKFLKQHGISSEYYHAGLDTEQRSQKQDLWKENKVKVIVATNAFGMGIDKPDVRFVIHYDMPESLEAYYQEAGRAGRDEKKAYAVLLYQPLDKILFLKKFEQNFPGLDEIKKTYHFINNYFQLAIGSGEGLTVEFNVADFCNKFKLEVLKTLNAIKFLEQNELMILSESAYLSSRLQFLTNGEDLYKFQVENFKYDGFIKNILRAYGGSFDQFVNIKEFDIAKRNNQMKDEVIQYLKELDKAAIISYAQQTNQPQIYFAKPRIATDDLLLDKKYYQERKDMYRQKMEAMLKYATEPVCRSLQLLKYFDEKSNDKCGVCDVCISEKKAKNRVEQSITKLILKAVADKELTLEQLIAAVKTGNERDKIAALRLLLDAGELKLTCGLYHL